MIFFKSFLFFNQLSLKLKNRIFRISLLVFLCLTMFSDNLWAYYQDDEWPLLPTWCRYTQAGASIGFTLQSKQVQDFISQVGEETWLHLHHYCNGLLRIHQSYGINITEPQRQATLERAVGEITYVIRNAPSNSIFRPELLTKRGQVYLRLKKYFEAERDLQTSIKEKPDYWPAYGYLSDLYLEQGKLDKARLILETGLKVAPDAKGLKNHIQQLNKKNN